jgi:3-phenylpropionate/cinnamic acid dioxygenase small subunit
MSKTPLTILMLAGSLLLLGANPALADRDDDREAINALMWRYARALDTFNPEAYVAVYTEDGEFLSGGTNATRGRQALYDMVANLRASREQRAANGEPPAPMFHMTADSWIEFIDDNHARHHSYWMTVFGANGPGTTPTVAAAGRGVDELVKVNGQWLIKSRNVAPQD